MKTFTSALLFLSSLVGLAAAESVLIKSYCPYPIYFVNTVTGGPDGLVTVLEQGQSFKYPYAEGPTSLKFAKDWPHEWGYKPGTPLVGEIPITQFEYNYIPNHHERGRYLQYNWSNMDCQGHQGKVGECPFTEYGLVAERPGCTSFECKSGDRDCKRCYQRMNNDVNIGCFLDESAPSDMVLSLCNYNVESATPSANLRRSRIWPGDDKVPQRKPTYIVKQQTNSTQLN